MSKRERKLSGEIAAFMRQYRRKSDAPHDPNDRHYDRELEAKIKRMPPEDLDRFLHGDADTDEMRAGSWPSL
jgi:hypothetical protein